MNSPKKSPSYPIITVRCGYCGRVLPERSGCCPGCGRAAPSLQEPDEWAAREKKRRTALLLCFFLGIFGAHKFYEEKLGMGALYLLTGGLLLVGVVVDLVRLFKEPDVYTV